MLEDQPTPRPYDAYERGAKVVDQVPTGDGDVLVTFALPSLQRAVVRVPWAVWAQGEHLAIGHHLAAASLRRSAAAADSGTEDDGEQAV